MIEGDVLDLLRRRGVEESMLQERKSGGGNGL